MTPERLLTLFDRISDAPDAVSRLRRFILDLAVRGKLVEQDPDDEPARLLVEATLNAQRKAAYSKTSVSAFDDAERDVLIPPTWVRAAFGALLDLQYGDPLPAAQRDLSGSVEVFGSNGVVGHHTIALTTEPAIIVGRKGSAGAINVASGPSWTTDVAYFVVPPPYFDLSFLSVQLRTLNLESLGRGVKPGLSRADAYPLPIVVPPLTEQHRIVARVDELMALCDQFGAAQAAREAQRDGLAAASLQRLNEPADDPADFREHVSFHLSNLPRLVTRPDHIPALRQTILNLAVRGKLVQQDPNDEPAAVLIDRLQKDRATSSGGRDRQGSRVATAIESGEYFGLPQSWTWVRLQDTLEPARGISYGVIKLGDVPKAGGVPTLRCSDVKSGYIDLRSVRLVSEEIEQQYARTRLQGGELLINVRGTLGGVAVVPDELRGYNIAREVAVVPIFSELNGSYLANVVASDYFWNTILGNLRGLAYKGLNLNALREFLVPLPPLAEQSRIVNKVNELLAICDELGSALARARDESRRLLEAVLHEALASGEVEPDLSYA